MKQILDDIITQLNRLYSRDEARELAFWILEESTGMSRTEILTADKITKKIPNYKVILQRILKKEPIQYIFGHTEWLGLNLKVTPATLIPRPETAELVAAILRVFPDGEPTANNHASDTRQIRILDIGTGSGCIAIAIKKQHPDWEVFGLDISAEALSIAQENAQRNQVEIHWLQGDIFTDEIGTFDLIVSNPPYVLESEKATMDDNVLLYEPHTALFVPDSDPLRFYRRIAQLHKAPMVAFEINQRFANEMIALMQHEGYESIELKKDTYGNDRILLASLD
ncbi:MAG: peptide chain release factor N(5)-glutamine methyltransferase [Paludibacteraceae bacterium]|nr:peptide chain release factor N(5)-glutamine methyltransferase [Paludibacteraceae bacterium]